MTDTVKSMISNGVEAMYFDSSKFKKSVLSVSFFQPLDENTATACCLASSVVTRATKDYSTYRELNARLHELYGASLGVNFSSVGDMQQITFKVSCLDDKYTFGEKAFYQSCKLLCEMLFTPLMKDGLFLQDSFESEKRLLIEDINAELNNKRAYALRRLQKHLYKDELSAISCSGDVDIAQKLTNVQTVEAYNNMLKTAFVRINMFSGVRDDEIFDMFRNGFDNLSRNAQKLNVTKAHIAKNAPEDVEELMDVTQGKLALAFSVDCGDSLYDKAVLRIMTDIYGGGTYSKLFSNVREKQSLCYYCTARASFMKRTVIVDSGILNENRDTAKNSILKELDDLKKGVGVDEAMLETSKKSIVDSMKSSFYDSVFGMDTWYRASVYDDDDSVAGFIDAVKKVTLCDVLKMADTLKLDTVYFLGKQVDE